jgi:hypothetical protein
MMQSVLQGLQFGIGVAVILYGMRTILAELVRIGRRSRMLQIHEYGQPPATLARLWDRSTQRFGQP